MQNSISCVHGFVTSALRVEACYLMPSDEAYEANAPGRCYSTSASFDRSASLWIVSLVAAAKLSARARTLARACWSILTLSWPSREMETNPVRRPWSVISAKLNLPDRLRRMT